MRKKSRSFSIYLLKDEYNHANALKEDSDLQQLADVADIPPNSTLYLLDNDPKPVWWRGYFGIRQDIRQVTKGAILFITVNDKCFALTFGHVFHHLKDISYEYDFGLKVTLNSLDPNELKSVDMVEPGPARRKRTQVPVATELTYLDFDSNSEIIKSLTGKVKEEYKDLFTSATGAASLKVALKSSPTELPNVCLQLLELYNKKDYEVAFPNILNIAPIKDPDNISRLDERLLTAFEERAGNLFLTIPDIIDYRGNTCCIFTGEHGKSDVYPDISLEALYDWLDGGDRVQRLSLQQLKDMRMVLTDADGQQGKGFSVYRSLVYDAPNPDDGIIHHLCEGDWYRVEQSYAERLKTYLDAKCEPTDLLAYNHDKIVDGKRVYSEASYNEAIPEWNNRFICLDQTDISPRGQTNIEPCDLYCVEDIGGTDFAKMYHVKISTRSSSLSHLFNQGVNSTDIIELEPEAKAKMKVLLRDNIGLNDEVKYLAPIDGYNFKVIYAIITRKDADDKSDNLPLFSKISLMRTMQMLDVRKIPSALSFIEDQSEQKGSHKQYPQIIVEVFEEGAKKIAKPIAGQGHDVNLIIKRLPKDVRDAEVGSRYKISIKVAEDGSISSHHTWPFEEAVH